MQLSEDHRAAKHRSVVRAGRYIVAVRDASAHRQHRQGSGRRSPIALTRSRNPSEPDVGVRPFHVWRRGNMFRTSSNGNCSLGIEGADGGASGFVGELRRPSSAPVFVEEEAVREEGPFALSYGLYPGDLRHNHRTSGRSSLVRKRMMLRLLVGSGRAQCSAAVRRVRHAPAR